jgi:hypothetical protein
MNREKKLIIAKIAYKEITNVIRNLESYSCADLHCNWNGIITVDDTIFLPEELDDGIIFGKLLEESKNLIEKTKEDLKKYRDEAQENIESDITV